MAQALYAIEKADEQMGLVYLSEKTSKTVDGVRGCIAMERL